MAHQLQAHAGTLSLMYSIHIHKQVKNIHTPLKSCMYVFQADTISRECLYIPASMLLISEHLVVHGIEYFKAIFSQITAVYTVVPMHAVRFRTC